MTTNVNSNPITANKAMAFFHEDGIIPAWNQAMVYAGKKGHIATLPEIINARTNSKPGDIPWSQYFTTSTAEYCGISSQGKHILIVAHGIGPMSTIEGIKNAYSWQYNDKSRSKNGGRITHKEFLDLEAGKYGKVSIVDLDEYFKEYKYPFCEPLAEIQLRKDPVFIARVGDKYAEYVEVHSKISADYQIENNIDFYQKGMDLKDKQPDYSFRKEYSPIIDLEDSNNCPYRDYKREDSILHNYPRDFEEGYASAHLISIDGLSRYNFSGFSQTIACAISCHGWRDNVCLLAVCPESKIEEGILKSPDVIDLLHKYWNELIIPVENPQPVYFCSIVKINGQYFTQYPKVGETMDTFEPEYLVTKMKKAGKRQKLRTTSGGSCPWFRYGINEAKRIAPPQANAYQLIGDPVFDGPDHHVCLVDFYKIETDNSQRIMQAKQLKNDFETIMRLYQKDLEEQKTVNSQG